MTDRPTVRARELVEQLWSESDVPPPLAKSTAAPSLPASDHVLHRPELAYLNGHWVWEPTGGRGWLGKLFARLFARVLDRYLLEERAFVEALVRFQNDLARKSDQLSEEIRQLEAAQRTLALALDERLERIERQTAALHGVLEARVERLEQRER